MTSSATSISLIVPNRNGGRFLPRCLDSILAQTRPPAEILVMDGASTDDSLSVIASYADVHPTIRFRAEPDSGPADAINKGIRFTTAPLLTWLNADDALDPRALERALTTFENNPKLALVYGSVLNVTAQGAIAGLNRGLNLPAHDLAVFDFIPQAGAVFKRFDGLQLDARLQWGFDWELWIQLAQRGDIHNLDHIVGYCIVEGIADRKSDMLTPRRTLELASIARRHAPGHDVRVGLAYLTAILGYACTPLGMLNPHYHRSIVRAGGRLHRLLCGRIEKGIML